MIHTLDESDAALAVSAIIMYQTVKVALHQTCSGFAWYIRIVMTYIVSIHLPVYTADTARGLQ